MITANPADTILIGGKYEALVGLYNQVRPEIYLEIGCYRLNTAINLIKLHMPKACYLFDLFEKAPDFEVPPEKPPLSIQEAVDLIKASFPNNTNIKPIKGNTALTLPSVVREIENNNDLVFVFLDGGHSYQTTMSDLKNVSDIKNQLVIAIDDADWHAISLAIRDFMPTIAERNPGIRFLKKNLCYITLDRVIDRTNENILIDIIKSSKSILDIGANIGQSYIEYKSINPNCEILSIEANQNCEEKLKASGANYIIAALGDKNEDKNFFVNKKEPTCQGASFFKERTEFYLEPNINISKIAIKRLDDLAEGKSFDFIKIDTQGSELPIINGGVKTIKKAKWLLVETPVLEYNEGSATFEQIESRLFELGFQNQFVAKENFFGKTLVQKDIVFKNVLNK